jgi:hypothetical protein
MMNRSIRVGLVALTLIASGVACSKTTQKPSSGGSPSSTPIALPTFGPAESYHPLFDPSDFSANVDNPWFPLPVGKTYVYTGTKDGKPARELLTPSASTKVIAGVECRVVVDKLYLSGRLAEDTLDYYTQDRDGNVWYFGEATRSIEENGSVDTSGSWTAGVAGAQPGVFMEADPQIGREFRQEYLKGEAEDQFKVVSLSEHVTIPYGTFDGAQRTEETTTLEPGILDNKYYVKGVGEVREIQVKGPPPIEKLELVEIR